MIQNSKALIKVFNDNLSSVGFVKKGCSWYFAHLDTISVIDLQKSEYGGQYFVNLAICVRSLCSLEFPREELCQLRLRLDRLVGDRDSFVKALNLEDFTLSAEMRLKLISDALTKIAVPWLFKLSTVKSLSLEIKSSEFLSNRSTLQLKKLIEELHAPAIARIELDTPTKAREMP